MDDIAQLKKQLDNIVSVLRGRLADANERKTRAERTAESSQKEIEVVSKALEDFKPLQGYYGLAVITTAMDPKVEHGHNRTVVVEILSASDGPMTTAQIAKIAHEQSKIKSTKGYKGVYATVATVLSRGKNVFMNHKGQWDLRERRIVKVSVPAADVDPRKRPERSGMLNMLTQVREGPIPPEIARLKIGSG